MTSGQYCIGAFAAVEKLFYSSAFMVPLYVKLSGDVEIDFSQTYTTDKTPDIPDPQPTPTSELGEETQPTPTSGPDNETPSITDADFKYVKNLKDLMQPHNYFMLGMGVKIMVGAGLCDVMSARDYLVRLSLQNQV